MCSIVVIMTPEDKKLCDEAMRSLKARKRELLEKFASDQRYASAKDAVSIFMAGSPGAGKTEYSVRFIEDLMKMGANEIVRIDPDLIREEIPQYTGGNAYIFQRPISWGVDKLHDYVLHKDKHFILDGTFSNKERSVENVKRSLKHDREVVIFYIYQKPEVAWEFTKAREEVEGRRIPKEAFISQHFGAKETAQEVKRLFGEKVELHLLIKDFRNDNLTFKLNIDSIDGHVDFNYTEDELKKRLYD